MKHFDIYRVYDGVTVETVSVLDWRDMFQYCAERGYDADLYDFRSQAVI